MTRESKERLAVRKWSPGKEQHLQVARCANHFLSKLRQAIGRNLFTGTTNRNSGYYDAEGIKHWSSRGPNALKVLLVIDGVAAPSYFT